MRGTGRQAPCVPDGGSGNWESGSLGPMLADLSPFLALGQAAKPASVSQHDTLSASLDQSFALPGAENAADGMQGRARHRSDVLTADREVDLDAGIHLLSSLLGKTKQRMRHTLLNLLVGDFDDA